MEPGVSLTMIGLNLFGMVGRCVALCVLTSKISALKTAPDYTSFSTYCDNAVYEPYLHDYNYDCIPENLSVFIFPEVTYSATPSPPHPYAPP